jgi:hypothetical protein
MSKIIDWLVGELGIEYSERNNKSINDAKIMDMLLQKEIWDSAHQAGRFEGKGIADDNWQTFEDWYNENVKR